MLIAPEPVLEIAWMLKGAGQWQWTLITMQQHLFLILNLVISEMINHFTDFLQGGVSVGGLGLEGF